jgi:hypothetical protein
MSVVDTVVKIVVVVRYVVVKFEESLKIVCGFRFLCPSGKVLCVPKYCLRLTNCPSSKGSVVLARDDTLHKCIDFPSDE